MSDWWEVVEGALERLGDQAPDPWADTALDDAASALTPEQRAFLEQMSGTPHLRFRPADDDLDDDPLQH
ncbi:MAG: hypothetical protein RI900_1919 [Actinomycetota bacterium]|jgi:hypothetical protein